MGCCFLSLAVSDYFLLTVTLTRSFLLDESCLCSFILNSTNAKITHQRDPLGFYRFGFLFVCLVGFFFFCFVLFCFVLSDPYDLVRVTKDMLIISRICQVGISRNAACCNSGRSAQVLELKRWLSRSERFLLFQRT